MSKQTEEPKRNKKGRSWFIRNIMKLIIIFAAIGVLTFISKIPKKENVSETSEVPPVNVKVMKIVQKPEFADTFRLPAVVEPNRIITISSEIDGRIESIPVTEGSNIKKGDLLVRINTDLIQPQYEMTQSQLLRDEI